MSDVHLSLNYFHLSNKAPEQAETQMNWPAACLICLMEHGRTVLAKSRQKAIRHRMKRHRWHHDILVSRGLIPAAEPDA